VNLQTQACSGWSKGLASSMQVAKKPVQCSLACVPVLRKTILRPTCVGWLNGEKLGLTCTSLGVSAFLSRLEKIHKVGQFCLIRSKYFKQCLSVVQKLL